MVVKEFIDSDRVNFLVWRYLLEGNYRETAAKFQKEWHVKEPHQEFPFAPHVNGHALVSVINRGLLYYALERQRTSAQAAREGVTQTELPQVGIFGPLITQPPAKIEDEGAAREQTTRGGSTATAATAPSEESDINRKRPHQLPNGSPAKRLRLSNGFENGSDVGAGITPMDVDQQDQHQQQLHQNDNHAYPSPLEGEQVTTPTVHTEGPAQGTQVDKVEELLPNTTFIRLINDTRNADDPASPGSEESVGGSNAPILLHCEWNPKDPSLLAAAGTDALARVWSVPRASSLERDRDMSQNHISPDGLPLLDSETPSGATVTALAWATDGSNLAIATEMGSKAAINICSPDGMLLQTLNPNDSTVVKLSWNPSSTSLLSISPEKPERSGAIITVYETSTGESKAYTIPDYDMTITSFDAVWTSDNEFLLSGGDMMASLRVEDSSISLIRKFDTKDDDSFTQVLFDPATKLAATASDKGVLDLWDESGHRKSITAHRGAITTMAWQPLPPSPTKLDEERLIATGGEDCAILIWNARMPESKTRCFLTMDSPIVRLAFTPDGAFIAGATSSKVLIWKVENTAMPRATWARPSHSGWLSPRANSDSEEEDEHCLCWDASGQKLAYGSNSRLAVINFSH